MKHLPITNEYDLEQINRLNFRSALEALSRPGTTQPVQPLFDSALLALASMLLYAEVTYHYEGDLDFQMIGALTGAEATDRRKADYLFSESGRVADLHAAKPGTSENPEFSATLVVDCGSVQSRTRVGLHGPGINGQTKIDLPLTPEFIAEFMEKNRSFPLGVDLLVLLPAQTLIGLARTTVIEVLK